jgi:hypothetical protein
MMFSQEKIEGKGKKFGSLNSLPSMLISQWIQDAVIVWF